MTTAGSNDCYVSSIHFSFNVAAIHQVTVQRTGGQVFARFMIPAGVSNFNQYFDPPIQINNNSITVIFGAALAVGDDFISNIYGWSE